MQARSRVMPFAYPSHCVDERRTLPGPDRSESTVRARLALFVLAATLSGVVSPVARAVAPRLNSILPTGGQQGTEVELRFAGQRLDDTRAIVLYAPGLSVVKLGEPKSNSVTATIRIDTNCAPGEHLLRLRSATGVSEIRSFWVGSLPVIAEVEPNNEPAKAQRVDLNVTIAGTIASEDIDSFMVHAEQGQRLSAEIEAMRLGRGASDPWLGIRDAKGQLLASADDSPLLGQDAFVSLRLPQAGDYLVQVRETSFGGRDDFHYRLHLGTFPRPRTVFPAAGRVGEKLNVRFLGDVAGDFEQEVQLPAAPVEKFAVFAAGPPMPDSGGSNASGALRSPSPNWIHVTTHPSFVEHEPNDLRDQAGESRELPAVFTGVLGRPGDRDWFRFHAHKGQSLQVTVFARRLRSPVDSVIQVVNAKGTAVADNDDAAGPDSALTFKPEEDGDYAVLVRDHQGRGGPEFVYCVEVVPVEPSLSLKIPEVARNDSQGRQYIAVPRGNRFATMISAKRSQAGGELTFKLDDLPDGVKLHAQPMPGKLDQFPLLFEADASAPIAGKLLDLVATSTNGVKGHFRNDIEFVPGPNNSTYVGTRVDRLLVAVVESAPFRLRLVEPRVPLVQGGALDCRVEAERDPGFEEPITLKMLWNPPGVTSQPEITLARGATNAVLTLNARSDADPRAWPVSILGSAGVNGGELHVSTALTTLRVGAPFLTARIETASCLPGQSTNILVHLDQQIPFAGRASVRLMGLPDKVSVAEQPITKDDKEVIFNVKVDPTCPTGSHRNLFCSVAVKQDGETITHSAGQGGILRIVPPRKTSAPTAENRKVARSN